jgi:hypothetical protein
LHYFCSGQFYSQSHYQPSRIINQGELRWEKPKP